MVCRPKISYPWPISGILKAYSLSGIAIRALLYRVHSLVGYRTMRLSNSAYLIFAVEDANAHSSMVLFEVVVMSKRSLIALILLLCFALLALLGLANFMRDLRADIQRLGHQTQVLQSRAQALERATQSLERDLPR